MKYRFMRYPEGKTKAVTFSYDDGYKSDLRLAGIFEKYGFKATFNLNTKMWLSENERNFSVSDAKDLLTAGHEIANHGAFHKALGIISSVDGIKDVLDGRQGLEERLGGIIRGYAYPDTMRNVKGDNYPKIKAFLEDLGMVYARLCGKDSDNFDLPEDFHSWYPNAHHDNPEIFNYIDKFNSINVKNLYIASRHPRLFFVWGHSSEFDSKGNWDRIEKICQMLSAREDTWYASCIQICEYVEAYRSLRFSVDGRTVYNPTLIDVWFSDGNRDFKVASGQTLRIEE